MDEISITAKNLSNNICYGWNKYHGIQKLNQIKFVTDEISIMAKNISNNICNGWNKHHSFPKYNLISLKLLKITPWLQSRISQYIGPWRHSTKSCCRLSNLCTKSPHVYCCKRDFREHVNLIREHLFTICSVINWKNLKKMEKPPFI